MQKKVVVIGAGISGMVAGVYARKMGFETDIYESHTISGGMCTAWHRKGFTIDGCIHWLTGSKEGSDLYKIWETCGALGEDIDIMHHDYISAHYNGKGFNYIYANPEKLEKEFLSIAPEDEKAVKELVKIIKTYQKLPIPANKPQELLGFIEKVKFYSPYIKAGKYSKMASKTSIEEYVSRFQSPVIRQMLTSVIPNIKMSATALFFTLATFASRDGGWPSGGSYAMAQRIKEQFLSMGGNVYFGTPVKKILIENEKAVGIELNDGEKVKADYVIPAISADVLLNQLLEGKYEDAYFEKRFTDTENYQILSSTLVAFGIDGNIDQYPYSLYIKPEQSLHINKTKITGLAINHYSFEPLFSPKGKSLIEVMFDDAEFEYWQNLKSTSVEEYRKKKEELAEMIMKEVENVYPAIKGKIEVLDVATPLTFHRYTNTYHGTYMSFCATPKSSLQSHKGIIARIKNMYPAGQWMLLQGGLPMAAIAGKFAVQRICVQEKIKLE